MNPVAFKLFGLPIMWYGVLIGSGVLLALALAWYNCKKKNVDFDTITTLFLIAFPCAIVGARLYYVIFEFSRYKSFFDVINIRQGGLAIHGGIIGALLSALIYTRIKKIEFLKYADIAAPSIILAQAIGRWGNFMNSEAHGGPVSAEFISKFPGFIQKGMYIDGTYYQPTFLYESAWNIVVLIILLIILYRKKDSHKGIVIASYIGLYSVGRCVIEGLRTDSLMFYGFRVAQLVSITAALCAVVAITYIVRNEKAKKNLNNSIK
ncbi:prolipoprotein diacylglyceryl transferase [Inconstantimicrobium mannanitabidum]|uniref:Prolipoprotein diacylglyceryl transferase n=1 Tax=Inconstantimicrobium mannanitabidum TaxID=1604901 RepID=A0ACB5RH10_9CLOT|nr:prolipoprotein diacylglyceryl transferase [Clostridium sp. TW13]GKX68367.1 prolipoprotein diacylglyceryl transferase [Clostridium sp. TW13]